MVWWYRRFVRQPRIRAIAFLGNNEIINAIFFLFLHVYSTLKIRKTLSLCTVDHFLLSWISRFMRKWW